MIIDVELPNRTLVSAAYLPSPPRLKSSPVQSFAFSRESRGIKREILNAHPNHDNIGARGVELILLRRYDRSGSGRRGDHGGLVESEVEMRSGK
jgi:hypothetical protein